MTHKVISSLLKEETTFYQTSSPVNQTFTATNAFQYSKAVRIRDLDEAKLAQEAKDALSAKRLGDKIRPNEQWTDTKESVITEVIENKCVQMQMFREKLRSVKNPCQDSTIPQSLIRKSLHMIKVNRSLLWSVFFC